MYPFIELFGIQISMTGIGILLGIITFVITCYQLCKKNHQDFFRLFSWLPLFLILSYLLGRYTSFVLDSWNILPGGRNDIIKILSPHNFDFHYVGLMVAALLSLGYFFSSIKRTENKKIWADIFFSGICNALIILGIFLTLGDSVIGKATDSIFAIKSLHPESELTKFNGVYPVGIFLSIWALFAHILITLLKIIFKKNGLGMLWFILLIILVNICFLYQNYPRYGLISLWGISLDVKQYFSFFIVLWCIFVAYKWSKKRFY